MSDQTPMTHLERTVNALALATPFAMGVRFADMRHCVEASVCGALALKRHKVEAKAIPCSFVAFDPGDGEVWGVSMVGHNMRSAYEWHLRHGESEGLMFDEWKVGKEIPDVDDPLHLIIEARHGGKRALVDLTAGQAKQTGAGTVKVPKVVIGRGAGWPRLTLEGNGWIEYGPSPRKGPALWRAYQNTGLVDDMADLMTFAIECELDPVRFSKQLSSRFEYRPEPGDAGAQE